MQVPQITAAALGELSKEKGRRVILDVRNRREYETVHIPGSKLLPIHELSSGKLPKGRPLYVLCATGNRARRACETLVKAGESNVFVIEGGIDAWLSAGLPVVRGEKGVSIDRQAQIVAGSCVLLGSAMVAAGGLAYLWIPMAFGAVTAYAGLTGHNPLKQPLSQMPWN